MAIEPITRKEQFLAKAGGQQVRDLEPITREEMFLQKIAEHSSVQPDLSQNDPDAADFVKGKEEVVFRPDTAEVGQTIVVKSVGENGNPTEWEAADLPSSDVFIVHCGQSGDKDGSFYVSESNDEIESAIAEGKVVMLQVNKEGNFANFVGKSGLDLCFVGFVGDATDNMHFYLYRLYGDGYCLRSSIYSWT